MALISSLPMSVLEQMDVQAERFAAALRADAAPPFRDFLKHVPPEGRAELLRLLLSTEAGFRRQQGRPLRASEARERCAELGSWAAEVLARIDLDDDCFLDLEVVGGPHVGRSFQIGGHSTCLVGRGPGGVHLAVENDPELSRVHFLVEYNPPAVCVSDLRSKNGTYLNGHKVEREDLRHGDTIRAGQSTFRVNLPSDRGLAVGDLISPPTATIVPAVPGYELLAELGRGAMGVVYKAKRSSDGRLVALKMILPTASFHPSNLARFQRETAILQNLAHPHIVAFHEAGEAGGLLYLVMEYIAGPSTAFLVKQDGPFAPPRVVALGCQLLEALAHAHVQGFVHRDVKPGNLLLAHTPNGEAVKLADFGLGRAYEASAMSGLTLSGASGGTPGFMPPEQVLDFRAARPPADQYAAAATLYYLLTGQPIYEPTLSIGELMVQILHSEPIPLRQPTPALPGKLGEVLRRALACNPCDRFPDVLAMREALRRPL